MTSQRLLSGAIAGLVMAASAAAADLRSTLVIPRAAADLLPTTAPGANTNRLGGFFSDISYDRPTGRLLSLTDRGPGGGMIPYDARLQQFSLTVDPATGTISGLQLTRTIPLTAGGQALNGLNPALLNGSPAVLGRSLDPEGLTIARNGNLYVADEYGPSVLEFTPAGTLVRAFATPANLVPREAGGAVNLVAGRPVIATGRQDNRGFEGIAISPDGSRLYAVLQGPLVQEGDPDGRRGRHVRIVEFDTATGQPGRQFVYQLESLADINARLPSGAEPFGANAQGRIIGLSAIVALNATEFLVIERDNRGLGIDDPTSRAPVASKRVYRIDISGATDVSGVSLAGLGELPVGVAPVSKTLFLDVAAALSAAGQTIPEKLEGLAVGQRLNDGRYALLIGTDNDFSATQNDSRVQFDICTDGTAAAQVALNAPCPAGQELLPTYLYSFRVEIPGFVEQIRAP